jgi:Ecdysteroid kinase-like family
MSNVAVTPEEMPEWLTADFLRQLLSISADISIGSVEFACAKGENFASKIFRVVIVQGDDDSSRSLIVKSRPVGDGFSENFSKKFKIFPKEIEMYEKIECFEQILAAHGNATVLAPR